MQHMNWDDLRFFLAVAQKGSIRGASEALSVNASTVSRRIDTFEKKLGTRLFERLPTGYILTSAGEEILESSERIEDEVAKLDRNIIGRDAQLNGSLTVTMAAPLATHLLMPDFVKFGQRYPGIELELSVSSEEINLSKREADVAIRITNNPPEYLVGRHITDIAKAAYASHEYLATHNIKQPELLRWIGWEDPELYPTWVKESIYPKTPVRHKANDILVQLEAAKSGMGMTILPCFMADSVPELTRISPISASHCGDIWILTHKDLRYTARVRIFMDYIVKAFEKHIPALTGSILQAKDQPAKTKQKLQNNQLLV
ncbi:Transcriptional regulator, LysR family [hydrothermal vent metagenome]|uniref:Transcriptional regulator, LysR family n=1 Tax=hydrothermal vent metagenome TaxID=652676 RepID=A0A3B0YQ90_9ZZZZ